MIRPAAAGLLALALAGCAAGGSLRTATPLAPAGSSAWTRLTLEGGGGQTGIALHPTNSLIAYAATDNGGLVKTTDGGLTWAASNHNLGNRKLATVVLDPLDPETVYVAAEVYTQRPSWSDDPATGELYRSRAGGAHWEIVYAEGLGAGRSFSLSQWPSTRNLLIPYDPADPGRFDADGDRLSDVLYVGGWDEDAGTADPRGGVWRSQDEGRTFTQLGLADQNIWVLRQHPTSPEILYAGTYGGGLWFSGDGGRTWESWRARLPLPTISDIAVAPDGTLYVATNTFYSQWAGGDPADKGLFRSTDGGATFVAINRGLEATSLDFTVLLLDPADPSARTLYAGPWRGSVTGVFVSRDGGDTWARMAHEQAATPFWFEDFSNLWALAAAPDGTLLAGTWRGLYRYDRAGERWQIRSRGLGNIEIQAVALAPDDADVIYLGLLDSPPWKSEDGGRTWRLIDAGFTTADGTRPVGAADFAIAPRAPQTIYAAGVGSSGQTQSAVNKTEDGGQTWRPIVTGLPPSSTDAPQWQATAVAVSALNPAVAYLALDLEAGGGALYKTDDGGAHWAELLTLTERPIDLAVSWTSPEVVVAATQEGGVFIGEAGGTRWRSTRPTESRLYAVDVFPSDPRRILVGANTVGALLTVDGGGTWQPVFTRAQLRTWLPELALSGFARERYQATLRAVKFDPLDPDGLYLGHSASPWMGVGVLVSRDGGASWRALSDDVFQMRSVNDIDLDPVSKNLVVGSWELYYYRPDFDKPKGGE